MNSKKVVLLNAVSATGAGAWMTWPGGKGSFIADAATTFAPVQLEVQGPSGAASAIVAGADTTLAAAGGGNFELPPGQIRANITSGSPSGVTAIAVSTE